MSTDPVYLAHIRECLERIHKYTAGGKGVFMSDHMAQDAVLRNLQTMAESTKRLTDDFKHDHPSIEWRNIAGFRNVIVHDYLGVSMEEVWEIVEREIPRLEAFMRELPSE